MKNLLKIALMVIITLSLSSVYAQEEVGVVRSRSNIKTNKQSQGAIFGDKVKPQVIETEEGWEFVNVKLTDEQKINLNNNMPNRISMNVSVGKSSKKTSIDELLESGNFFIKKEGLTKEQIDLVLKTKHNTVKNSVGNIR